MCGDQMIQMLHQRKLNSCGSMSVSRPKSITRKTTRYHLCWAVVPVQNQPGLLPRACHRSWYIKVTRWQGIYHPLLSRSVAPFKMQIQHFLNSMDCIVELTLLVLWTLSVKWMQKKRRQHDKHAWYHSKATTIQNTTTIRRGPPISFWPLPTAQKWSPDLRQFHQTKENTYEALQNSENRPMSSSSPPRLCLRTASTPCKQHAGICAIKRHMCFPATKNKQPTL